MFCLHNYRYNVYALKFIYLLDDLDCELELETYLKKGINH